MSNSHDNGPIVLRLLANVAAGLGLAAFGLALGDFARGPSPLGVLGLAVLVAVIGAALARLYRPGGIARRR